MAGKAVFENIVRMKKKLITVEIEYVVDFLAVCLFSGKGIS